MPRLLPLATAAAATLLLAASGCGGSSDDDASTTATGSAASLSALNNRTFVSTSVDGHTLADGSRLTLTFDPDLLVFSAGCNSLRAGWKVAGDRIQLDGEAAGTLMACEPALQEQDRWLSQLLAGGATATLDGDQLTLTDGDVRITLQQGTIDTPPPIKGTDWTLDHVVDRDGTVTPVPGGAQAPTLRIDGNRAQVFAGCNRGGGSVQVGDDGLGVFEPIALTMMACEPEQAALEQLVTSVLEGTVAFGYAGDDLSVARQGRHLVFTAGA